MNDEVLAILLAGGAGERLDPLTRQHCKPSIPFGGIYRLVDIPLSNCINSGCYRICVLTQHKALTLNRHIRQAWNFLPAELGAFVEVLPPMKRNRDTWYLGTADAVYQNIATIAEEGAPYTLILSADHIYKMDYRQMLAQHVGMGADVTVATTHIDPCEAPRFGIVTADEELRIASFEEKPPCKGARRSPLDPARCMASLGIYLFSTPVLLEALSQDAADATSRHDFGHDILPRLLGRRTVGAYDLAANADQASRYWRDVGTLDAYYEANMDLLGRDPQFKLDDPAWPLRAAAPVVPPARFVLDEWNRGGFALDSLVSQGCRIEGGNVSHSVLSPGVCVKSRSRIEDCVVLSDVSIGANCRLRRCIVEEGVKVADGFRAGIEPEKDRKAGHFVMDSGVVVIHRDSPGTERMKQPEVSRERRMPTCGSPTLGRDRIAAQALTTSAR